MDGKLFVIDGLDGSGKATQKELLINHLSDENIPVRGLSFPNYESPSSALVKMYLAGEFGQKPDDVNAYAASSFYAVDRYAGCKQDWGAYYSQGGFVLADRYTTSNLIHQCAKLPYAQWNEYHDWLEEFEYKKLGIPAPHSVFFLDVDPDVSQELLAVRYQNEDKRDIHERDLAYLQRCRDVALWCVQNYGWIQVLCTQEKKMRPAGEIHAELYALVKESLET
ncbi:thymidylate kinase [Ruminococcaceae bacterium OttesenSCG-928-I18]|nr:thymidylate kinase [Ruminococcaceae bacterium OttesenSCG-928-I18]